MSGFTFNGIKSNSKYIKAIKTERVLVAKRKHTTIIIPESDNVILIPDKTREPFVLPIECLIYIPRNKSIFEIGRELDNWLSQEQWSKLTFDDDPNYSYDAICTSEIRVDDLRDKTKNIIIIEFLCKFEVSGV